MKHLLIAAAVMVPAWSAASAQDSDGPNDDLRVRVGLGAQVQPKYVGADDYRILPLPRVSFARGSNEFDAAAPDDSFSIPVFRAGEFSFGPAASIATKRKDSDVGAPVGKVPTTFELGAYGQYEMAGLRFRGEVRKGIGGHDGIVGQFGADKIWRDGDRYVFSLGPRVLFSDSKFQRAYFGVDGDASLATGLRVYRPGGGIHGLAAASGLTVQLNNRFGLFGYARYERLIDNGSQSPLIRAFGSRNQYSGGLGLSYTFFVDQ